MRIAIVVPAFDEEQTIVQVIESFHRAVPKAALWVIDNNSSDRTGELAQACLDRLGCLGGVLFEGRPGKSFALRKAFSEIEADQYVTVDADLTYRSEDLIRLLDAAKTSAADMVVGDRHAGGQYKASTRRRFHDFGNRLVRSVINALFDARLNDIMSGFRVMNRRFVKLLPLLSSGFEVETEITLHALDKRFEISEVEIAYDPRPEGSRAKLNTYRDGARVLITIVRLFKDYRPLPFFSAIGLFFFVSGVVVGFMPVYEFITQRIILRIPSAILATGLMILAFLVFTLALLLDTIVRAQRREFELRLLSYGER